MRAEVLMKPFAVRVYWKQHSDSLEELHANIFIEGALVHSVVLKKKGSVRQGKRKRAIVTYMVPKNPKADSGCEVVLPFTMPTPLPSHGKPRRTVHVNSQRLTYTVEEVSSELGTVSVNVCTGGCESLSTVSLN